MTKRVFIAFFLLFGSVTARAEGVDYAALAQVRMIW